MPSQWKYLDILELLQELEEVHQEDYLHHQQEVTGNILDQRQVVNTGTRLSTIDHYLERRDRFQSPGSAHSIITVYMVAVLRLQEGSHQNTAHIHLSVATQHLANILSQDNAHLEWVVIRAVCMEEVRMDFQVMGPREGRLRLHEDEVTTVCMEVLQIDPWEDMVMKMHMVEARSIILPQEVIVHHDQDCHHINITK